MGLSFFVHFHGDPRHAGSLFRAAGPRLQRLKPQLGDQCDVIVHSPLAVSGDDPLPVEQDARMLLCQLYCQDEAALTGGSVAKALSDCLVPLLNAEGVRDVHSHTMTTEWLRAGSPEDARAPAKAVSFFVQYDGPAEDPDAFHRYYRAHHVPIVFRMPGIRSLTYYLPTRTSGPAIGQRVDRLQLVQAVFDSADDFLKMRRSSERKEGLRDFDNYPKFEGPVTHQVMNSERIG
jgi:uncharacterized protein (TIGR02118 family)